MAVDAVVLAGRENTGKLREASPEKWEANIEIAGRPMVTYILDALKAVPKIGTIYLIGPEEAVGRYACSKVRVVEPGGGLLENVRKGLSAARSECVLVCASDIPLVTAEIVGDLIDRCLESGADFCYPVSSKDDCDRAFSGVKRTYVTLREGTYTGGNVFLVRKSAVERAWPMAEKMIGYRKSPAKMVAVLGPGLLLKFVLKLASVADLERKVAGLLDLKPRAILNASPEIGVDVDKPSDLELCRRELAK
ncbi:MAG: molybdenum cofactor guanylyltransferase [Bacillota bacterium]|jgi:GTP:adenosylcobinamide-phosphate guanylyltransferase|nr:NTP transferase domain-containing protein [Candidatus Fermentithermobacillaceae bacterium]